MSWLAMKTTATNLAVVVGLSVAAAVGIGVAVVRSPPAAPRNDGRAASEAALTRPGLTPAEQVALMQSIAQAALQRKDYANAIAWAQRYVAAGGAESDVRPLRAQAHFGLGDFANAARELQLEIQLAERSGQPPGEDRLLRLQKCYARLDDATAFAWVLEKLLTHYPKREYWADLLDRMQRRSDFGALEALDVNRLRLLTGTLVGAPDFIALASQAREAGFPAEARRVVDMGLASGVLGRGPDAAQHRRLQRQLAVEALAQQRRINQREVELAAEKAKDGIELFDLGFAHVTLGNYDKGLALMDRGLSKGHLAGRPQYARLRLGIAHLMAGNKAAAIDTFKHVGGRHAAPDLARVWGIYAGHAA